MSNKLIISEALTSKAFFFEIFKPWIYTGKEQRLSVDESPDKQARVIAIVLETMLKMADIGCVT